MRLAAYLKFMVRSGIPRMLPPGLVSTGVVMSAALTRKRFLCSHLSTGDELCINSDLTVACSCLDEDGSAVLGSLKEQSLDEIFAGPVAQRFRVELARGRLPINACLFCPGLHSVHEGHGEKNGAGYSLAPESLFVENTVLCNLHCTSCPRDSLLKRAQMRISVQDIERVAKVIRLHKVKNVWFYNWGEPFLSPTIGEELAVMRDLNPDITITLSTNGLLLDSDKKRETALLVDHAMFSIFGSTQKSLTRYQRGGNFERSWSNMRELVRYRDLRHRTRPKIEWKYVLFRWNDSDEFILRATELAKQASIDVLSFRVTALPGTGISYRFFLSKRLQELMKESTGIPRIEWHGDATSSDSS